MKRFNLALPETLYGTIEAWANKNDETVTAMILKFCKLGILIFKLQERGGKVYFEEPNNSGLMEVEIL